MYSLFTNSRQNHGHQQFGVPGASMVAVVFAVAMWCLGNQASAHSASADAATFAPADVAKLIANAESAGPAEISKHATILAESPKTGELITLRKGNNGWTCLSDHLATPANDPMCLDDVWMEWMMAAMENRPAKIDHVGLAYMLRGGEAFDQRDPFLTSSPPGKKPYFVGPHVMVIVPNPKDLEGVSHDVYNGGPFVEALKRDHPIILIPVAAPGSTLKVIPGMNGWCCRRSDMTNRHADEDLGRDEPGSHLHNDR